MEAGAYHCKMFTVLSLLHLCIHTLLFPAQNIYPSFVNKKGKQT